MQKKTRNRLLALLLSAGLVLPSLSTPVYATERATDIYAEKPKYEERENVVVGNVKSTTTKFLRATDGIKARES